MKYKYVHKTARNERILSECPSAGLHASVKGMRKKYWGKDALIVKCGGYIYNVPPYIWYSLD